MAVIAHNLAHDSARLLRLTLRIDAVASAAAGVLALAGLALLPDLLGTPVEVLLPVGALLLVWAATLWLVASQPRISAAGVWAIVGLNALWVVGSFVVLAAGLFALTVLGTAFVIAQAAVVAVFANLEFVGMRRALAAAP